MIRTTVRVEGLSETVAALGRLSRSTQRNVLRRVLTRAGEPIAERAQQLAPNLTGLLDLSITTSTQLTRRERGGGVKLNEAEVYVGPASVGGALYYATHVEFGTIVMTAQPYMRPAWDSLQGQALDIIKTGLWEEIEKAAARAARKAARLAARG